MRWIPVLFTKRKTKTFSQRGAPSLNRPMQTTPRRLKRLERNQSDSKWKFLRNLARWWYIFFLGIFFLAGVVYIFFLSPLTEVDQIHIEGGNSSLQSEFQKEIDASLNQSSLKPFSRRNFFLFPIHEITTLARERFPHIRSVEIRKQFPKTVSIHLEVRDDIVVFCSGGPCFAIDESGSVLANEDTFDDSWKRIRLIDRSGVPINTSEKVVSSDFVVFLQQLKQRLQDQIGIPVRDDWETPSRFSGMADVRTQEGWVLRVDSKTANDTMFASLKTFLTKRFKTVEVRNQLDSIDMRTSGRIYYQLRGESTSEDQ